ncbi:MAG: hypothetical protein WCH39_12985 [Schlesneria sp.]
MRSLFFTTLLLISGATRTGFAQTTVPSGTGNKAEQQAQPNYDPPSAQMPDDATLKRISEKTEELRRAIAELKQRKIPDDVLVEVEVYLKGAENIVRFSEWYAAASGKWALTTLDQGLARARQAEGGQPVWANVTGKWVVRAYRSSVDGSIQPYAVLLPHDYHSKKDWRLDVVLHGRDSSLTEAKFIATHSGDALKDLGYVQLEVYGRGNNAYRWAGEADVFEAIAKGAGPFNPDRLVLRGFSMGGAGTWHIGLHHPDRFCVLGPGAGFTTTRGYVGNLPKQLPDYVEKSLHIYDAVDYSENTFNVPVVAYSGEKDPQKKAVTNIESALSDFKEPLRFTHLIAPGLEHQMPKEWQEKAETGYRQYADAGRSIAERVRFVTYTPKYGRCDWVQIDALRTTYERAVVDGTRKGNIFDLTTKNVRRIKLASDPQKKVPLQATIDGQRIETKDWRPGNADFVQLEWVGEKWVLLENSQQLNKRLAEKPEKSAGLQGPIDDAFTSKFAVIKPTGKGFFAATDDFASAAVVQFARVWDKYFRGTLPFQSAAASNTLKGQNLILFGDPQSNPLISEILPKLPIKWTNEKLVMNGIEYDSKTHIPVMIYPNPTDPGHYVVLNSGHTFREADLKGTNALLYPRLGDWAVIKPMPTPNDPSAYEVVYAGLFDENWQFLNR